MPKYTISYKKPSKLALGSPLGNVRAFLHCTAHAKHSKTQMTRNWALPDAEIANRSHVGSSAMCFSIWGSTRWVAANFLTAFRCWLSARSSWIVPVQEPLSLTGHTSTRNSLQFAANYASLTPRATQIAPLMISARWEGPLRGMSVSLLKYDRRLCICRLLSQIVSPRCLRVDTIWALDYRFLWRWVQNGQRKTAVCLQKPRSSITRRQGKMQRAANSLQMR